MRVHSSVPVGAVCNAREKRPEAVRAVSAVAAADRHEAGDDAQQGAKEILPPEELREIELPEAFTQESPGLEKPAYGPPPASGAARHDRLTTSGMRCILRR